MYANFYNLKKEPFHITPDPEFLFLSPSHKEALGSIIYGIGHKKGFVLITGEVGVGKTTIVRSYLEDVDRSKLKIIYIFNSNVSFQGLLRTIYRELGIIDLTDDVFELVNQLHYALIEEYKKGITVVLIIDEAQNMPVETLENIRMLSNLETSTDKLIQIVFSGQPEFEQKLERKELRQLQQRIAVKATIYPLTAAESRAYILHRLKKASAENSALFTDGALRRIIREAHGIPRRINILCENAFITALGYKQERITSGVVKEVISDFSEKKRGRALKTALASLTLILAILSSYFMYVRNEDLAGSDARKSPVPPAVAHKTGNMTVKPAVSMPKEPSAEGSSIPVEPGGILREPTETASSPVIRVVKAGDTLSRLVAEVYGVSNKELLTFVKDSNSSINDADRILVGDQILFPARKTGSRRKYE
ncbi:MAG: AAA family ATPase [Geobacteraceae bacterium]|nr:AAA family ATPase [Geobacteraceae bacterium]